MLTGIQVSGGPVALGRALLASGALLACFDAAGVLYQLQTGRITTPVIDSLVSAGPISPMGWLLVMAVACVLLALGIAASIAAATIGAGNVLLMATDHQLYSNHQFLLVLLCSWFAVAQSDRARSVRARLRPSGAGNQVRWWPQLLIIATVSACYLFAGLSKLNPEFLSGDLIEQMAPSWVPAQLAARLTVPAEIVIGIGIWWRPARRYILLLGVLLHLSIVALLGSPLVFAAFALLCFSAYPLVLTWPQMPQADATATQRSSVA